MQQASGLHMPSAKDVAPFSSKNLVPLKKPNSKKSASFARDRKPDEDEFTAGDIKLDGDHSVQKSDPQGLMTDETGVPVSSFHTLTVHNILLPKTIFPSGY
jgi:hypothetical protein